MALYAIGDFHLSKGTDKPMDIFGDRWKNHVVKIEEGFAGVSDEDLTVICGDLSWGIGFDECKEDFRFLNSLPGRKILLKGNHDYWWTTMKKMKEFLSENSFDTIEILNNNFFEYTENGEAYAVCGTRGWFFEEETGKEHDRLIMMREVGRLRASLEAAEKAGIREKLVFLHYPPLYVNYRCDEILSVLKEFGVRRCFYGHIHGKGIPGAFNGWLDGTEFRLVSADFVNFKPEKIRLY